MPCRFSEGMVRVLPETIALAILLVGVIALVGKYIRVRVRLVQKLFLPVSIIGGFLALVLGPEVLGRLADLVGISGLREGGVFGAGVLDVWSELPGLLISAVFATMFLGAQIPSPRRAVRLLGPQLSLGLTFASGQYVIGLILTPLTIPTVAMAKARSPPPAKSRSLITSAMPAAAIWLWPWPQSRSSAAL